MLETGYIMSERFLLPIVKPSVSHNVKRQKPRSPVPPEADGTRISEDIILPVRKNSLHELIKKAGSNSAGLPKRLPVYFISGTISNATMLITLIIGLIAGPAVSL